MAHAARLGRFEIHLLVISDHLGVAACRVLYRTNGHILRANHHFAATSAPEKKAGGSRGGSTLHLGLSLHPYRQSHEHLMTDLRTIRPDGGWASRSIPDRGG